MHGGDTVNDAQQTRTGKNARAEKLAEQLQEQARTDEHKAAVLRATGDYLHRRNRRSRGHTDESDKNLPLFDPQKESE